MSPQPWRFAVTIAAFFCLFCLLALRLHRLQVEEAPRLAELGERQHERTWMLPAARGGIYDRSGAPLAESQATWTLLADPLFMEDRLRATVELARVLGVERDDLRKQFETGRNGRTIAKGLDDRQADAVRGLGLAGLYLRRDFTRIYREGGLAAHVLGFVNAEGGGGAGIEQKFDQALGGTAGHESILIDSKGVPVVGGGETVPAKPGANVELSIDLELQRIVEKELAAGVERHQPKNAAAILVVPATGEIVAMASWPTYSPSDHQGLGVDSMRDNPIGFVYEPGSVMKPLVAGAAVSEGLARWNEQIFCEHGRWTYHDGRAARTISDHSYKNGGHGMLTVVQGIALSDNILMAKLGLRMGPEKLWQWETLFGFGRRTGICLPGEDAGLMLRREKWSVLGSCMSVPMGHEIEVTPLQMAMAHAAIANGGVWLPPRLVRRVYTVDERGEVIDQPTPALPEPRRFFTPEHAAEIQDAMTHTMTEGTGKDVQLDGYVAAGKSGTAEKVIDGHYSDQHHVGSFICMAPAQRGTRPELLCLVVMDDSSRNGHYGAETAGPVVEAILQQALEARGIPKTLPPEDAKPARNTHVAQSPQPAPPQPRRPAMVKGMLR
jgi:cell division protein FtsI (penicillin-binding protein 3)